MPPLKYHVGQLAAQQEARTTRVAEQLAQWVGPVAEFATGADLLVFATADARGVLQIGILSGKPPLLSAHEEEGALRLELPEDMPSSMTHAEICGGLAISFATARRARINGALTRGAGQTNLHATETFTLCKKYVAPTIALDESRHIGPVSREPAHLDDPAVLARLEAAETAFLATLSPAGAPDVAHRGGPAGFLRPDAAHNRLSWHEFVGDGVFKSAGNIRAIPAMTLVVPDFSTGDAIAVMGRATYTTVRNERQEREDALVQHRDDYPVQGLVECEVDQVEWLRGLVRPRRRLGRALKITSRATTDAQAPQ